MKKSFFGRLIDNLTGKSLKYSSTNASTAQNVQSKSISQNHNTSAVSKNAKTNNAAENKNANFNTAIPEYLANGTQSLAQSKNEITDPEFKQQELSASKLRKKLNLKTESFKTNSKLMRTVFKLGLLFISIFIFIGFLVGSIFFTKLDQQIFVSSIEGYVYDDFAAPLENVEITIGNRSVKTNSEGYYRLENVGFDPVSVNVALEGFSTITETIELERKFLDYSYTKNFFLESTNLASIYGKFVPPENYEFTNTEKLLINDREYPIKSDGSFIVTKLQTGATDFKFTSPNFFDFSEKIDLIKGINKIEDITLSYAADVIGNTESYITEANVSNISISITNNPTDTIKFDKDKKIFRVTDLQAGKSYTLRIEAPGYQTRQYSITTEPGENKLFGLTFVEAGRILRIVTEDKFELLKISDFDGLNSENLFSIEEYKPTNLFFDSQTNRVYFLSTSESLRTPFSSRANLAYVYDLTTGELKRSTLVLDNIGLIFPSFESKTLVSITHTDRNADRQARLLNLNGDLLQTIRSIAGREIQNVYVSKNLSAASILESTRDSKFIIYKDLQSKEEREVISSPSADLIGIDSLGNRVIFKDENPQNGFTSLQMYDNRTKERRVLIPNFNGRFTKFLNDSDNEVLFVENVGGKDKIFIFDIEKNSRRELLELRANDTINNIKQIQDYIAYEVNEKVYISNIDFPKAYKLVGDGLLW
ncbi:MAG: hypothetical protein Kow0081_1330 [Candidatus Dojkabacteria bacterium]